MGRCHGNGTVVVSDPVERCGVCAEPPHVCSEASSGTRSPQGGSEEVGLDLVQFFVILVQESQCSLIMAQRSHLGGLAALSLQTLECGEGGLGGTRFGRIRHLNSGVTQVQHQPSYTCSVKQVVDFGAEMRRLVTD